MDKIIIPYFTKRRGFKNIRFYKGWYIIRIKSDIDLTREVVNDIDEIIHEEIKGKNAQEIGYNIAYRCVGRLIKIAKTIYVIADGGKKGILWNVIISRNPIYEED